MGLPFLLAGMLFHSFLAFFKRFRKHIRLVEIATGLLLMVVGAMLFFDMFNLVTAYLYRFLPPGG